MYPNSGSCHITLVDCVTICRTVFFLHSLYFMFQFDCFIWVILMHSWQDVQWVHTYLLVHHMVSTPWSLGVVTESSLFIQGRSHERQHCIGCTGGSAIAVQSHRFVGLSFTSLVQMLRLQLCSWGWLHPFHPRRRSRSRVCWCRSWSSPFVSTQRSPPAPHTYACQQTWDLGRLSHSSILRRLRLT